MQTSLQSDKSYSKVQRTITWNVSAGFEETEENIKRPRRTCFKDGTHRFSQRRGEGEKRVNKEEMQAEENECVYLSCLVLKRRVQVCKGLEREA